MKIPNLRRRICPFLVLVVGAMVPVFLRAADETVSSSPSLNVETTAKTGDDILHQGAYFEREVIQLSQEVKIGENGAYTLTPGFFLRTGGDAVWGSYTQAQGPGAGKIIKAPGVVTLQDTFLVSGDGTHIDVITNYYQAVRGEARGITRSTAPALSTTVRQKALVYGGAKGSVIKLGYREIWMNIQQPSEIQFVEHDLAKSKVVESHGARIEILSASGDTLRYRVLHSFD